MFDKADEVLVETLLPLTQLSSNPSALVNFTRDRVHTRLREYRPEKSVRNKAVTESMISKRKGP